MLVSIDAPLLAEADRYALRSGCLDCLFFVADGDRCGHGWPNQRQRLPLGSRAGEEGTAEAFCKEFELR